MSEAGLRILVLDGGGVKALTQVETLAEILLSIKDCLPDEVVNSDDFDAERPCQYFDIMAGCGTGGLLAVFFGRLGMTITECTKAFKELAAVVFTKENKGEDAISADVATSIENADMEESRYDDLEGEEDDPNRGFVMFGHVKLESELKRIIKEYTGSENTKFRGSNNKCGKSCKVFVSVKEVHSANDPNPPALRSYPPRHNRDPDCMIWEAVRATLADPELFRDITVGDLIPIHYFGAGLGHNNPTPQALIEVNNVRAFRDLKVACIFSIGAGKRYSSAVPELNQDELIETQQMQDVDDGFDRRIRWLVEFVARECETVHREMARKFPIPRFYYRFNVEQGADGDILQEWDDLSKTASMARAYLRGVDISKLLVEAADVLVKQEGVIKVNELLVDDVGFSTSSLPQDPTNVDLDSRQSATRPQRLIEHY